MGLGSLLRNAFGRPKQSAARLSEIKAWTRAVLRLPEDTALAVNEIVCNDPSCPGTETVILIMEPGRKTRACKIEKSADAVTEEDVRAAVSV